jgi:hypothetical protein
MLLLLAACSIPFVDGGTKVGDACDGDGDLLCTADGDLFECDDGEWSDEVPRSCGCDESGEPECG